MIKIDASAHTYVAVCDQCAWRGLALSRLRALERAGEHETAAHPEQTSARTRRARARRAQASTDD